MKKNDTVEYIGCSEEQIKWGNNDDPRSFLIVGKKVNISPKVMTITARKITIRLNFITISK